MKHVTFPCNCILATMICLLGTGTQHANAQTSGVPGDGIPDVYYFQTAGLTAQTSIGPLSLPAGTLTVDTDGTDMVAILVSGPDASANCDLCDGGFLPDPNNPPFLASTWAFAFFNGSMQYVRTNPISNLGYQGVVGQDPDGVLTYPDFGLANYGPGWIQAAFTETFDECGDGASWSVLYATDAGAQICTNVTIVSGPDTCGDGVLDPGEDCDDGNNQPGDCCSPVCTVEPGTPCDFDDDLCTLDICNAAGECVPDSAIGCAASVCDSPICNPATGLCDPNPAPPGTQCGLGDQCFSLECDGIGFCVEVTAPEGTACTPNGDLCEAGECSGPECLLIGPFECTPGFINFPDDRLLDCPAETTPLATGEPQDDGNCPGSVITFVDSSTPGCGFTETIVRTWINTDQCGNFFTQDQLIEVQDVTPPTATCQANADIVELDETCSADVSFTVTADDTCCIDLHYIVAAGAATGTSLTETCSQAGDPMMSEISQAPGIPIPDGDPIGITDTINMPQSFIIGDLDIGLTVTHTWIGDLCVTVEHGGTSVTVIQRIGDPGLGCAGDCCACQASNMDVVLDDDAGDAIDTFSDCSGGPGPLGLFIPHEALSAFNGLDSQGPWTITVADNAGSDTGTLDSWTVFASGVGGEGDVECTGQVTGLTQCDAFVEYSATVNDCCGNPPDQPCTATVEVRDNIDPIIECPNSITIQSKGSCDNNAAQIEDWLNGATATDNCTADPVITTDAPDCGFPPGTTTVTRTATDECGNTGTCTSDITIPVPKRARTAVKGSLLVYPNIEVKWEPDAAGGYVVSQDTVLSIVNEFNDDVDVRFMFVNGDDDLEALLVGNPPTVIERAHDGWTRFNWTTGLTANESTWYSLAGNSPSGPPAFASLDNGAGGPGRPDPESATGGRYIRGYALAWAVDSQQHEIIWNFLSGKASFVHYDELAAWEYPATAYPADCGEHGTQPVDCIARDPSGGCCDTGVVPGKLDLDGFQYRANYNTLLLDFYAAGSSPFMNNGLSGMIDTDLTLLPMIQDLRQNNDGPVHTKADFDIWDENEELYSGTERCIWCWDQFLLSDTSLLSNNFLATELDTDKGKARIDGVASSACDEAFCCDRGDDQCFSDYAQDNPGFEAPRCSEAAPLLGVAAKIIAFSGTTEGKSYAGSTLRGQGYDIRGQILADLPSTPEQLNEGGIKQRSGKRNTGR